MSTEPEPLSVVAGEEVLRRPARGLIGWLSDADAINALLGRTPKAGEDTSEILAIARASRAEVAHRRQYQPGEVLVNRAFDGLDEVAKRADIISTLGQLDWRPALVDLRNVLSFQKVVHVDGLAERVANIDNDASLLELCIPVNQPMPPSGAFTDQDGKGFTVSSFNPNLRVAGGQIGEAQVSQAPGIAPIKMQAITLLVYMGASYLQVVRYRGRSFIRDGYHRAAGLLRQRRFIVPCVFIEAKSFEEVGASPGAFSFETLYSEHPPRVIDFWDDKVSRDIHQVAVRKVIRVRGEEFVVPR